MSATPNTFIAAPVRYPSTLNARVKSCAQKIETACGDSLTAPTHNDKIGLWTWMSEWSAKNLAALEGTRAGRASGGAGQAIGGEGTQD